MTTAQLYEGSVNLGIKEGINDSRDVVKLSGVLSFTSRLLKASLRVTLQ